MYTFVCIFYMHTICACICVCAYIYSPVCSMCMCVLHTHNTYYMYVYMSIYIYISRVEETWERVILAERMRRMLLLSPVYECKEHYEQVQVQSQPIHIKQDFNAINKSSVDVDVNISGESSAISLFQNGGLVTKDISETCTSTAPAVDGGQAPILAIDSDDSIHTDSTGTGKVAIDTSGASSARSKSDMLYSASGPGSLRRYVRRINSELYKS